MSLPSPDSKQAHFVTKNSYGKRSFCRPGLSRKLDAPHPISILQQLEALPPSQKLSLAMGNWLSKAEVEEEDEEIFNGPWGDFQ